MKRLCTAISLAALCGTVFGATIKENETVEITKSNSTKYSYYDNATIKIVSTCTLQDYAPTAATDVETIANCVMLQGNITKNANCSGNAKLTIDMTEAPEGANLVLAANMIAGQSADKPLVIKGCRRVYFGSKTAATTLAYWQVPSIQFQDSDGNDITAELGEGEGLVIAGQATVTFKPTYRYSLRKGCEIALGAGVSANDFGYFKTNEEGELVLEDYDLYVLSTNSTFSLTAPIRIKPTRKLTFKPCTVSSAGGWSGNNNVDLPNDIILESDENSKARLISRANQYCFFSGSVTGSGDFTYDSDNYGSPGSGFIGNLDFLGDMTVQGNTSTRRESVLTFNFLSATPGNAANKLTIGGSTRTCFSVPDVTRIKEQSQFVTPTAVTIGTLAGIAPADSHTNAVGRPLVGELQAQAGQTITVGSLAGPGPVRLAGTGKFVLQSVASDATVMISPDSQVSLGTIANGGNVIYERTGAADCFSVEINGKTYRIEPNAGVMALTNAFFNGIVEPGANYKVRGAEGAEYSVASRDTWQNKLTFWMDPTKTNRMVKLDWKDDKPHVSSKYYSIEMISNSCDSGTYLLQNNYQRTEDGGQGSEKKWHANWSVYPFLDTDNGPLVGEEHVPFISLPFLPGKANRRMFVGKVGATPYKNETMPSAFVVMVFGAQNGGGSALLKDSRSGKPNVFGRYADCVNTEVPSTAPIFTNDMFTTWLDGKSVNPTTEGLLSDKGWHLVSFRTCGESIGGFGSNVITYSNTGGQNYGDIMVFSSELTDKERKSVERMLAKKWGLTYTQEEDIEEVALAGTGTVSVDVNVRAKGMFTGTLDVAAGKTVAITGALPPSAEDVAKIDNPVSWYDPDDASSLKFASADTNAVRGLLPRGYDGEEGGWWLFGSSAREPFAVAGSRTLGGPSRTWLDFAQLDPREIKGNILRFRPNPFDANSSYAPDYTNAMKSAVMVFDGTRYDTPLLDVNGGSLMKRRTSTDSPIWVSGTTSIMTGGKQYIDGVKVEGTEVPFKTGVQIFSCTTDGNEFPLSIIGDLNATNGKDAKGGGVYGEMLFFKNVLDDVDRKKVEEYLSAKWLGEVSGDRADYRSATVTGGGTIKVTSAAMLPKFAANFAGTAAVTETSPTMSFTVNGASVDDALDMGNGTLSFGESETVSVSVNFTAQPKVGVHAYKLISWANGKAPAADFALADGKPTGACGTREYSLSKAEDGLYLNRGTVGAVILLK